MPCDESSPKCKRGRLVKSTGEALQSQNMGVEAITLANRDTDDDDSHCEDIESFLRKTQKQSYSKPTPQRRNPERTKKAGRYVNPLAKSVKCLQMNHRELKKALEAKGQDKGNSSKTGPMKSCSLQRKRGVEVEKSN